jgi:hypothetical protein
VAELVADDEPQLLVVVQVEGAGRHDDPRPVDPDGHGVDRGALRDEHLGGVVQVERGTPSWTISCRTANCVGRRAHTTPGAHQAMLRSRNAPASTFSAVVEALEPAQRDEGRAVAGCS